MSNQAILFPMFGLAVWTALVLLLIPVARFLAVSRGERASPRGPAGQKGEARPENGRLYFVQTRVDARFLVAIAIAPKPPVKHLPAEGATSMVVQFARVQGIIDQRCVSCHSAQPTQPGFAAAPAGIMLHTPELIKQNAARVYQRSVVLKDMPLANLTQITEEERATIGAWYEARAKD